MASDKKAWFRQAVIYHILVDRFAGFTPEGALSWDTPVFVGGNLRGILSKLDYLADLGINTLWLSPFYRTDAYHGYHITDFMTVEDHFGTVQDLRALTKACHERGMHVIADLVPNHCHDSHPFFQAALKDAHSPYRSWFFFDDNKGYQSFLGCGWLPKLNLDDREARDHMIGCALYWLEQGIDGFRIDHVIGVSPDFLKALSAACTKKSPHSVLFGEAVIDLASYRRHLGTLYTKHKLLRALFGFRQASLQKDYIGIIDGVLDFECQRLMSRFARGELNRSDLAARLEKHFGSYPEDYTLVLFLDSHDGDRLLCQARSDAAVVKDAIDVMLSFARKYRQPVSFYYGTDILLNQVVPMPVDYPHKDLLSRRAMDWNPGTPQSRFHEELAGMIKQHLQGV